MKYLIPGLLLLLAHPTFACQNSGDAYVQCAAGCTQRGTPSALTDRLAQAAITQFSLCEGASVFIIGILKRPGGYAEYDTWYDVDASSHADFSFIDVSNEQTVRPPPQPGSCPQDASCWFGEIFLSGVDYAGGGVWYHDFPTPPKP